ncbi:MAG TPA: hypothetical protein VGO64_06545, partial [Candidatus Limnocylindrales bacterium]|nr:hypothetical protein [Candidatus Limnocylindrales bacterium]
MIEHDGAAARQAAARSSPRPTHDAEFDAPSSSATIEGLRPVIDRLPEAVLITDADGAVRATNAAADRLFAERPVRDDVDLLSRFEDLGAARRPGRDESARRLTVRPRHQPNTWFALDRVPLHSIGADGGRDDTLDGTGAVYLLRDVSDSGDLQAEREAFLAVLSHE